MSTIQLRDVTKIYPAERVPQSSYFGRPARGRVLSISQADRAFAERVAGQVVDERMARSGREGPVVALDHVNLTIADGQTLSVVGPSGCGKSTLLRIVAGLTEYDGDVWYDVELMNDVPPRDRYIGMVFQNYALYPHFEGKGNLKFFFRMHQAPDVEAEERIRVTSEIMGIGFAELLKRKPGTLSGGQQQRVAIARALVRQPRLFLFDEPLSNLDAQLRTRTRVEIKRLLHRFRITSIYVTHDQVEAITLGDQIAVMREGRIEQVGPCQELMDNPANVFVAGFLGHPPMNLLAGVVREGEVSIGEIRIPLPDAVKAQVRADKVHPAEQSITVGIRPQSMHLLIGDQQPPDGVRFPAVAEVVEPDYDHRTAMAHVRAGEMAFAAECSLDAAPRSGDRVELVWPFANLTFFDGASGKRLGTCSEEMR